MVTSTHDSKRVHYNSLLKQFLAKTSANDVSTHKYLHRTQSCKLFDLVSLILECSPSRKQFQRGLPRRVQVLKTEFLPGEFCGAFPEKLRFPVTHCEGVAGADDAEELCTREDGRYPERRGGGETEGNHRIIRRWSTSAVRTQDPSIQGARSTLSRASGH